MVLIECKFEITYRCILTAEGHHSPFISQLSLKLVRPEVSYLRFGLLIRHVIDESSPLYGMDLEVWSPILFCSFGLDNCGIRI
jgi:inward rectifier potassium channel